MPVKSSKIAAALEELAPCQLAESWDNVGFAGRRAGPRNPKRSC